MCDTWKVLWCCVTQAGCCVTQGGCCVTHGGCCVTQRGCCVTQGGCCVTQAGCCVTQGGCCVTHARTGAHACVTQAAHTHCPEHRTQGAQDAAAPGAAPRDGFEK
uniref:Uncharacterized protein n=1 Tax=Corvus moneduloides TaxID=1196302 RepID=A0A8U7MVM7_CORMO